MIRMIIGFIGIRTLFPLLIMLGYIGSSFLPFFKRKRAQNHIQFLNNQNIDGLEKNLFLQIF